MRRPDSKRLDLPTIGLFVLPILLLGWMTARQMASTRQSQALIAAAGAGNNARVKALLDRGADIEGANMSGETPLFHAAGAQRLETVRLLLDRGAKVNAQNNSQNTPIVAALNYYDRINGVAPKHDPRVARLLLERGATINVQPAWSSSDLLVYAVQDDDTATIGLLLAHDAAVNARAGGGATALETAVTSSNVEIVKILLEHGADPNLRGASGTPPLLVAVQNGRGGQNIEVVRLLLAHGAQWQLTNKKGLTPLKVATDNKEKQVVALLKQAGATR